MEGLTIRTERALLGAMITDQGLAARLRYLEPEDFTDPQHRTVFERIRAIDDGTSMTPDAWRGLIARPADQRITAGDLDQLTASCPDLRHGAAYGALLIQARLHRQVADYGQRITAQAIQLRRDAGRIVQANGTGWVTADDLARRLDTLAAALRLHTPATSPATEPHTGALALGGGQHMAPFTGYTPPLPATPQLNNVIPLQAAREQLVLAALIQHHPEAGQVCSFLPAAAFTDPLHQEMYRAIRRLHAAGRPVDPLTVDWELASRGVRAIPRELSVGLSVGIADSYTAQLARASISGRSPVRTADELSIQLQRRTSRPRSPAVPGPVALAPVLGPVTSRGPEQRM